MLGERKKRVLLISLIFIISISLISVNVKGVDNDVAVTNVVITSTTTILQGENVTLTVTVKNNGATVLSAVTVGIYYGASHALAVAVDESSLNFFPENITLGAGATTTLTCTWITGRYPIVPIGSQTVKANATIPGQVDPVPGNNEFVDGTVTVNQHDVGITNVVANMTKVEQVHNLTITVTVHNYAIKTEDNRGLGITIYAYYNNSNTQALQTTITSMTAGETRNVVFLWDPSGRSEGSAMVPNGTYTIKSQILPVVSFDNNASNNLYVDGKVQVAAHDVTVLNVAGTPTGVTAGEPVSVQVSVKNRGNFTETFTLNTYWNNTHLIGTQSVSNLARGASTVKTFPWVTTGLSNGAYFLNATALPVTKEINLTRNSLVLANGRVNIPKAHDVACTNGYTNTSYAKPGDMVAIYATVENQGDYAESSVTVNTYYATDPAATPQTISMTTRADTSEDYPRQVLTFVWDTSAVLYGTYKIWINITAVSGETRTSNNNYMAGQVVFTRMYISPTPHAANISATLVSKPGAYNQTAPTGTSTMYAHGETTTINAIAYYYLKLGSADAAAVDKSASRAAIARVLAGKAVLPLNGISSIPAKTWTPYYRAWFNIAGGAAHADADILIRQSTGAVRTTIATHVGISAALTTTQQTLTGATYAFAAYTVVDQTDYLEIDYYIDVTTAQAGGTAYLRLDDSALGATGTRISGVSLAPALINGNNAFDNDLNSYAYFNTNVNGYIYFKTFNNSQGGSLKIAGVDISIKYSAPRVAGGNDKFLIGKTVAPSSAFTTLLGATSSDTDVPLDTYIFYSQGEPNDQIWSWTDVNNLVIRYQSIFTSGPLATSDPENRQVRIYDIRITVYTTPTAVALKVSGAQDAFAWGARMSYDPTVIRLFSASEVSSYQYYLLKQSSADAAGMNTTKQSTGTVGRYLAGKSVFALTGISSIAGSTWTLYYRGATTGGTVHADVDILIRKEDNSIRSTIATHVGASGVLTAAWITVSGTYAFGVYSVVAQTDYLEIDYYLDVTVAHTLTFANLRFDDNTLALTNQTRIANVTATALTIYTHRETIPVGGLLSGPEGTSFTTTTNITGGYIDMGQTIKGTYPGVTGSGYLANITFVVLSAGQTNLTLSKLSMQNQFLQPLPLYGENGRFSSAHDVVVNSIVPNSRAYYYKGLKVTYTIKVHSFGPWTESFTLYLYTNMSVPAINSTVILNLRPLEVRTITLSWNTTTYAYGQHEIRAETSVVINDFNTLNNVKKAGTTMLTIQGDANGDKTVNVFDILSVKSRWGRTSASPDWIAEYDVNDDDAINVFDILTIKAHWGQSW